MSRCHKIFEMAGIGWGVMPNALPQPYSNPRIQMQIDADDAALEDAIAAAADASPPVAG